LSTTPDTSNPYHQARGIWNERYHNLVRARWNWQLIAFGELFVIVIFALALIWHASQSKVVPYVVRVDEAGQSLVIGPAQASHTTEPRIIGWQLQGFVRQVRQVTADRTAQKRLLDLAYQHAAGPAIAFLNTHFREEATNPFVRNHTVIVMPTVRNTLQIGERTWQVEWVETKHTLEGKDAGQETWKGQFEVLIDPPETPEEIVANPLGFKVTRISWSQTF